MEYGAVADFRTGGCQRLIRFNARGSTLIEVSEGRRLMVSIAVALLACAAGLLAPPALAQSWPTKPIRVVVPFAPGGSTDLTTRVIGEHLRPILGQPIVIDNRPGASGTIAGDTVAKAAPDGYTFLTASATLVANMSLYKNLPYDFIKDLAPITQANFSTNVLVVNRKVPVNTLPEFIAYVKSGKAPVHYGTAGHGSSQHLAAALFNQMIGGNMVHVPYKGGAPAMIDLVGGTIESIFSPLIEALPHIKSGALRPLGVCGFRRSPLLPDAPLISDVLPGYLSTSWNGFFAPVKTPPEVVNRMNAALIKVLSVPAVKAHFAESDKEPVGNTPAEFKEFIAAEAKRLREQVRISGAKVE
jgi:tripartite-type tricarboxylate transporter receptor subunit TctC